MFTIETKTRSFQCNLHTIVSSMLIYCDGNAKEFHWINFSNVISRRLQGFRRKFPTPRNSDILFLETNEIQITSICNYTFEVNIGRFNSNYLISLKSKNTNSFILVFHITEPLVHIEVIVIC